MLARARKSALLAAAAVLVSEVLDEISEGEEQPSGQTEALSEVIETVESWANEWEQIESSVH